MIPETAEHLNKVGGAIREAKGLLGRHGYPDNPRTVMVIGFISQMIEHHESTLLLIGNGKVGSAFALARSIVESMYRGLWMNICASDPQIRKFEEEDKWPVSMTEMADAIDEQYRAQAFFLDLKKRGWPSLCSYAHTGMLQLGRRFTGQKALPAYTDEEICEATTTVTTCVLLLIGKFLAVQGHAAESLAAEGLAGMYGPAAKGNAAPGA